MVLQGKTSAERRVSGKARILLAFILGSLGAFGPLTIDMYLPALPNLARELGTPASLAQVSLTACLLGLALGQVIMGPLSDVRGRKKPLIAALLVYAAASVLCVFASSIWLLILFRFIQGIAGATGIVVSRASVRDLFSGPELTKFFSMLMLVNGAAPILAPVAGGQLLRIFSWRGVFGVLAVLGLLMLLAVIFFMKETLPPERRKTGGLEEVFQTFGKLLKDKVFVGYALAQGFVMGGMFAYISGSTFVLQDIYGLSPQMFSVVFGINGLGIIAATQITGALAGKVRESALLVSGLFQAAISGILLVAVILLQAPVFFVCLMLFFSVSSVGIVTTAVFSLAMEEQGENAGSASALLGLLPFLFGAAAAPLVGIAGSHHALPMAIVIAFCELAAFHFYYWFVRHPKRQKKA
ncbi:multidrug effflux MFS transporter [Metabacillus sp. GX 13764]|uniref:multidrug effflux MFS transporter n=1 Tax=Metabacillus kandeliae TaxID=2900151 RepID=UPI001E526350|nr:multidrug effflux MFS transporter [Metabacillus kandeliae]MCD7034095.1 multidrug effflux MFS transporter [Metabacillus kandeliae]